MFYFRLFPYLSNVYLSVRPDCAFCQRFNFETFLFVSFIRMVHLPLSETFPVSQNRRLANERLAPPIYTPLCIVVPRKPSALSFSGDTPIDQCLPVPKLLSSAEPAAPPPESSESPQSPAPALTPSPSPDHDAVTGLFRGEIAQVRVWSSPYSDASLQRFVGRSGVLEADPTLVCLWKADEGSGSVLHNSRPLHPPKHSRGARAAAAEAAAAVAAGGTVGRTGAEGHAELAGEWAWVPCFDPDDYENAHHGAERASADAPAAVPVSVSVSAAAAAVAVAAASPSSVAQRSERHGEGEAVSLAAASDGSAAGESTVPGRSLGGDTDLARSLGWRSVSTAGDEEEEEEEEEDEEGEGGGEGKEGGDASAPWKEERERGDGGRMKPPRPAACPDTLAGASAALGAYAAMVGNPDVVVGDGGSPRGGVSAREALLGVLGKLYQQCSVYLAPCQGDPLLERMMPPPPRGARTEARVQLQLIRREERALKAVVQPEVCRKFCIVCVLFCFFHLGECLLLERKSCVSFVGDSSSAPPSPPPPMGVG